MKKLLNPYYIYILSFSFVIILNALKWSDFLIELSDSLIVFFAVTFLISFFLGQNLKRHRSNVYEPSKEFSKADTKRVHFIWVGFLLEFLYARQIPLLQFGLGISDGQFAHFGGIPTFHVIIVTYSVYYSCVYFYKLLSFYSHRRLLIFLSISLLPPLLMINRGMLFAEIISCLFIFLLSIKTFNRRYRAYTCLIILISLFSFAYLGKMKIGDDEDNRAIIAYTQPTEKFEQTRLPALILWPYIYASSPISNLELCVSTYKPIYSEKNFIAGCLFPDFISNRIFVERDAYVEPPLITPVFNVSSMYAGAYVAYGWIGMIILFFYNILILTISLLCTSRRSNENYTVLYSLVCTVMALNTFFNMWTFSAISFPIIWAYLDNIIKRIKWSL